MTSPSESELTDLLARARAWAAADPDATTRDELERIVAEVEAGGDPTDLADRFDGTLEFGTAGLRGRLGAGPNRMNRVVVLRAAAGLAAHLGPGGAVAIGYDARHLSDTFAEDTAAVMRGAGLDVWLLPRPLPTPVLAYAVRELGCVAGVMVTASHNPPEDNGYKVYLGDGSQIVSPVDAEIAERIAEVGDLTSVARGSDWQVLGEDLLDRYLDRIAGLVADGPRDLAVVHTSLHGVGGSPVAQVLERAGFPAPYAVAEQAQPDPDFPTVAFPNPEEDGAMDLALALAEQRGADLVVANDPDADRCAAAVPTPTGWRMLRGDEVGALLATHLLRRGRTGTFATTIVSSTLLSKIAAAAGQPYVETLTGFKWIGRDPDLAFGYEEALGYCCDPDHVKDKDGVSALVLLCELAASLKAEGRSLLDLLDDLARGRRPRRGLRRPAAHRRPALPPRRRRPRHRAPQRHRAEGEVLPRGRRPRRGRQRQPGPDRRRRGGPDLRRHPPGRPRLRHPRRRGPLTLPHRRSRRRAKDVPSAGRGGAQATAPPAG